jgi:hypothetical protein
VTASELREGSDPAEGPARQDQPELTSREGWIVGLVIGLTTVILAALLWLSRQL